jgi:hypothetical protein
MIACTRLTSFATRSPCLQLAFRGMREPLLLRGVSLDGAPL